MYHVCLQLVLKCHLSHKNSLPIFWLNDGLPKVFAGLLLVLQRVSSNNCWTTSAHFLGEFGSDDSALRMALVRVLVVLYTGDVVLVLPAFFRSYYHSFCSLSFSLIESRFSYLFNLWRFDHFSLYLSSPICPFNFANLFWQIAETKRKKTFTELG